MQWKLTNINKNLIESNSQLIFESWISWYWLIVIINIDSNSNEKKVHIKIIGWWLVMPLSINEMYHWLEITNTFLPQMMIKYLSMRVDCAIWTNVFAIFHLVDVQRLLCRINACVSLKPFCHLGQSYVKRRKRRRC